MMSEDFRAGAKARLMQRVSRDLDDEWLPLGGPVPMPGARLVAVPSTNGYHHPRALRRSRRWLWRGSAGLLAAVLGVAATPTASAASLPGEPPDGLKQAQ